MNLLDQLRKMTVVVADTGDFEIDRPVSTSRHDHQSLAALQGRADAALPIAARRSDRCGRVRGRTIPRRRWRP